MKEERDYIRDITEMRSMMERSSKFLSLSGLSAIILGLYALGGAFLAYKIFDFNPERTIDSSIGSGSVPKQLVQVILLATGILILALCTALLFSLKKAKKRREKIWNPTSQRLLFNMAVPLVAGGLLILILLSKGFIGLMAPFTLLFYGLAMFNASKFTYEEVKSLGLIQICLGLISSYYVEHGLLLWALGFGVLHLVYGFYLYVRYER